MSGGREAINFRNNVYMAGTVLAVKSRRSTFTILCSTQKIGGVAAPSLESSKDFLSTEAHVLKCHTLNMYCKWTQTWREFVTVVEVNLRPTVSRPVCPGVRHPSGTRDQFFFLLEISFR
jgi:hypothetical protein